MEIYYIFLILIVVILFFIFIIITANARMIRLYDKYIKINNKCDMTGKEFAFRAKADLNLPNLSFATNPKKLTDAYSSKFKTIIMSNEVCNSASVASLAIISHEMGHAVQDRENNRLFGLTEIFGRITLFTNKFIFPLLLLALIFYIWSIVPIDLINALLYTSISLFALHMLQKLLTIPLEFDASKKAIKYLKENNFIHKNEIKIIKKILRTAGQTYIYGFFNGFIIFNILKRRKN